MKFQPGQSGNPSGRPKGSANKASTQVKSVIEEILTDPENIAKIKKEFTSLSGRDLMKAYTDLLPYIVPKLSNTSLEVELEKMTDEQLEELYQRIINTAQ